MKPSLLLSSSSVMIMWITLSTTWLSSTLFSSSSSSSLMLVAAASSDKYCEDGLLSGQFCCHADCHQCGGSGCGANGMGQKCCLGTLQNYCEDNVAPCIMDRDQDSTGVCVFSTFFTTSISGNYDLAGHYNGKPYWKKDRGSLKDVYVYFGNGAWRIYYALDGSESGFSYSVKPGTHSQASSDYPFEITWKDSNVAVLAGSCEDYYYQMNEWKGENPVH